MNLVDVKNWELLYNHLCDWVISMDIPDDVKDEKLKELDVFDKAFRQNNSQYVKENYDE